MLAEDSQCLPGVEARQQGEARAGGDGGVEGAGLSERVEQGQPTEDHVVGGELDQFAGDVAVAGEVGVGQFGALRLTGRSRGVENHRGVVLVQVGHVLDGWGGREQRIECAGTDDDHLGLGLLRTGPCLVGEGVPGEQEPGA